MSDEIRLDWSAAEVRDGALTVPLQGETGEQFEGAFNSTVRLLGAHAGWGDVELQEAAVHVSEVHPGSEDSLRHHLDSIVLQAATTVAPKDEEERSDRHDTTAEGPDAEMTERFRAFAEPPEGDPGG